MARKCWKEAAEVVVAKNFGNSSLLILSLVIAKRLDTQEV
jgi:hypothetical protein